MATVGALDRSEDVEG